MTSFPPRAVQRIIDFVNTLDVDAGEEHLPDAERLHTWLAEHGLATTGLQLGPDAVRRAHEIREALRVVLLAHHDTAADSDVAAASRALASVGLRLRFTDDGAVTLDAVDAGIDGALGRLLAPIAAAAADGSWERAKICPNTTCQWAFYDHSRNRSRRWCSMEVCGNREKSKTFRERQAAAD